MSADQQDGMPPRRGTGALALNIGKTQSSPRGQEANDDGAIRRGKNGRFQKGTPSPNPKGAPRKPDIGPWHDRLQRKRKWQVDGRIVEKTDREHLDEVLYHLAMTGRRGALKLLEEREDRARADDLAREERRKQEARRKRERELGIETFDTAEQMEAKRRGFQGLAAMYEYIAGNSRELRDRLLTMGAITVDGSEIKLAGWLENERSHD